MWWHWGHKGGWHWFGGVVFAFWMFKSISGFVARTIPTISVGWILAIALLMLVVPLSIRLWQEVDRVNRERSEEQDKLKNGKPKNDADYRRPTEGADWFEERGEVV